MSSVADVSAATSSDAPAEPATPPDPLLGDWPSWEVLRLRYIHHVLAHVGGNKSQAAVMLGVDRRTLARLFERDRKAKTPRSPAPHEAVRAWIRRTPG
jgi:ActR/RegA family two-component response regulator